MQGKDYELLCMAYLWGINNPARLPNALEMAEAAVSRNQTASYTFNIIYALLKAESQFYEFQWCSVFHIVSDVNNDASLTRDMPEEAVRAIFLEIDTFYEHCIHPDERGNRKKRF